MIRFPKIEFRIARTEDGQSGGDGDPIVFRGTDPAQNRLTATMVNLGPGTLTLPAGDPTASIDFDMGGLLPDTPSDASDQPVRIGGAGWSADETGKTLTPDATVDWPEGATLTFPFERLVVGDGGETGTYRIAAMLAVPDPSASGGRRTKVVRTNVILADRPEKRIEEALLFSLDPGTVNCWPRGESQMATMPSMVKLTIGNRSSDDDFLASGAGGSRPTFKIVVPTIPRESEDAAANAGTELSGYGLAALTYPELASEIEIDAAVDDADYEWEVRKRAEYLSWEVVPLAGNDTLLGPGGSLVLTMSNILTPLPPFATRVYVLYSDLGDYGDGYVSLLLTKVLPEPTIREFRARPSEVEYGASTVLSWKTLGADYFEISHTDNSEAEVWSSADDAGGIVLAYPAGTMELRCDGEGLRKTTTLTLSLFRRDSPEPAVSRQATVTVRSSTLELTVNPPNAALGQEVELTWVVAGPWAFTGRIQDDRGRPIVDISGPSAPGQRRDGVERKLSGTARVKVDRTTTFTAQATVKAASDKTYSVDAVCTVKPAAANLLIVAADRRPLATAECDVTVPWSSVPTPATLSWTTDFAAKVALSAIGRSPWERVVEPNGTLEVAPEVTTTYRLSVEGFEAPPPVDVRVQVAGGIDILSFEGREQFTGQYGPDVAIAQPGADVELAFNLAYAAAAEVTLTWAGLEGDRGTRLWPAGDNPQFDPTAAELAFGLKYLQVFGDCQLMLTARRSANPMDRVATATVPVRVTGGPAIPRFSATAAFDPYGQRCIRFDWTVIGANRASIACATRDRFPTRQQISWTEDRIGNYFDNIEDAEGDFPSFESSGTEYPDRSSDQVTSGTVVWIQQPDYYRVPPELLGDTVFYLLAWSPTTNLPRIRPALLEGVW